MNNVLTVIFDCSGGFDENGKLDILHALRLSTARLAKNFGASAEFFVWRDEIRPLTNPKEMTPRGVCEVSALKDFFATRSAGTNVLLLSDGLWSLDDSAKIKQSLAEKRINSAFVAVGADARRTGNFCVSTVGGVWSPADLPAAIQTLLFGGES